MFQQAFSAMRQRHKEQLAEIHGVDEFANDVHKVTETETKKKKMHPVTRTCLFFFNEFRFIVLTTLVVLAALWLQRSIEEALNLFIKSKHPCKRLLWMWLFAFLLILIAILIGVLWKPMAIPQEQPTSSLSHEYQQKQQLQ